MTTDINEQQGDVTITSLLSSLPNGTIYVMRLVRPPQQFQHLRPTSVRVIPPTAVDTASAFAAGSECVVNASRDLRHCPCFEQYPRRCTKDVGSQW